MPPLSPAEVTLRLKDLSQWTLHGKAIRREFTCASFADALAFVIRVGFDAEAADHHPDIAVSYRKVTLSFSTHSQGGLTAKDFAGAEAADQVGRRL